MLNTSETESTCATKCIMLLIMKRLGILKQILFILLIFSGCLLMFYKNLLRTNFQLERSTVHYHKWIPDQLVYLKRRKNMLKVCNMMQNDTLNSGRFTSILSNKDLLEHLLVDSKDRILYCYVPKESEYVSLSSQIGVGLMTWFCLAELILVRLPCPNLLTIPLSTSDILSDVLSYFPNQLRTWFYNVACTNWKRVFMIMIGMTDTRDIMSIPSTVAHQQHYIPSLINFTKFEIQEMLQTYTKFIFVRHPFERLLSAYKNKFEQNYNSSKYFHRRFGRKIVKMFRANASHNSLLNGNDVRFSEFVSYVTSKSSVFNEHWKPIDSLCDPCLIDYDFIGKYETLNTDAQYLLDHIRAGDISFPQIKPSNTSIHLSKYISQLSYKSVVSLYKIYYNDFKLFHYNLQSYLGYDLE